MKFIGNLPNNQNPELFGFHPNAEIIKENREGIENCQILLNIEFYQEKNIGLEMDEESNLEVLKICQNIISKNLKKFDIKIAQAKYPYSYLNSMNSVLLQELERFNQLVSTIINSLKEVEDSLKGIIVISDSVEEVNLNLQILYF